ncbi:hypothetical protein ABW20_dc0104769 [Dactylellina cionopaga]|nr:hypothetical protein ABW20_dc0104769 [Dactylellina cionopaga]
MNVCVAGARIQARIRRRQFQQQIRLTSNWTSSPPGSNNGSSGRRQDNIRNEYFIPGPANRLVKQPEAQRQAWVRPGHAAFNPTSGQDSANETTSANAAETTSGAAPPTIGLPKKALSELTLPAFDGPSNIFELNSFLRKYVPSQCWHIQTGPWIWVRKDRERPGLPISARDNRSAVNQGKIILKESRLRVSSFQNPDGDNQPATDTVVNWAKVLRMARDPLKDLAQATGYTYGGWFDLIGPRIGDELFSKLAMSLISGPLRDSPAHAVRMSTAGSTGLPAGIHVIGVMQENVFDRAASKQILDILVKNHGWVPEGSKADLYTELRLGHIHQSKSHSCINLASDFYTKPELEAMKYSAAPRKRFQVDLPGSNR